MVRKIVCSFVLCWMLFILYALPSDASFEQSLNEGWSFYNEQFITSASTTGQQVELPIEFDELTGSMSGYGTFITTVEGLETEELGLFVPFIYGATKVYINGELFKEIGHVGKNAQNHDTDMRSFTLELPKYEKSYEIAIQISSFNHIRGGFSMMPIIGSRDLIEEKFLRIQYNQVLTNAIIIVVGIMTTFIGLLRSGEKEYFVFGLFSLMIALRGNFTVPFLYHNFPFDISYEWATRLEYITTNIAFILYATFIYVMYKKLFSKYVLLAVVGILVVQTGLALFATEVTYKTAFFNIFPLVAMFIIYNLVVMVRAVKRNMELARPLLLGIIFVFIGLVLDYLSGMGVLYLMPTANFMIALNVIFVLFAISQRYVKQIHVVTQMNTKLEDLVASRTNELAQANTQLKRLVNTDALTGCFNRHKFNEAIEQQFAQSIEDGCPLGLLMIDVDEFKRYNDHYGHVQGDVLLKEIVVIIQRALPYNTLLARYGGEEFAVILTGYTKQQCVEIGEQLVTQVAEAKLEHIARDCKIATISAGCAERITDNLTAVSELIVQADERLYVSKKTGRNKITAN